MNVVYRDLKLENLLLDMDGHIRLSDFGLSARLRHSQDLVKSMSGTAGYLAPEILTDHEQGHGKSVDIWAFGVTMFILLLRESPFYSENLRELFDMVIHEEIQWEWYKREISPSALDLLRGLLTKNPQRRLGCGESGIGEIRRHPFFASVDWDEVYSMKNKPPIRPTLRVCVLPLHPPSPWDGAFCKGPGVLHGGILFIATIHAFLFVGFRVAPRHLRGHKTESRELTVMTLALWIEFGKERRRLSL